MGYKLKKIYMWVNNTTRGLPAEYQEVEYIQSSGTQYIDTLHNHGTNTKFEIKFAFQTMTTEWNALCGARTNYMSNDDMDFFVHYRNSAYTMRYGCGGSMNDTWVSVSLDTPYVATLTKDAATLGGTTTSLSTNLTSCSYNDWVFGVCNSGTQVDNLVKAKVYYFKIWDNDVLARDFVPCYRKSDNVIGMYDLVNDVFYTNNGSGVFTKGADVPDTVEKQVRPKKTFGYWTINGYTDTGESFSPTKSGSYGYTCGLNISGDGNKLYCGWSSSMGPYEVTLNNGSLSGATATSQGSYHPSGRGGPCEVVWKPDGSMFYLSQNSNGNWTKGYTTNTAWNMAGATQVQTIAQTFCSRGRYIDTQNGLYVVSMGPDSSIPGTVGRLSTYRLGTARDVSSGLTYVSDNNIGNTGQGDGGIFFNENGTHLYLGMNADSINIAHYVLSTPRDVSTCTLVEQYNWSDFGLSNSRGGGICFYGTNMYLWNNGVLKRYTVTYNS